eukprot:TRINITY_DN4542_c0_g2_i1.p1 TRINITY_DN4542_c0_g2~~TRINITY_DN4542_c0_g2_i1.p1  ORF type:complete len:402 (-),score=39.15 TRINITY_DN4542_c0_g2_i1:206-1411(-)
MAYAQGGLFSEFWDVGLQSGRNGWGVSGNDLRSVSPSFLQFSSSPILHILDIMKLNHSVRLATGLGIVFVMSFCILGSHAQASEPLSFVPINETAPSAGNETSVINATAPASAPVSFFPPSVPVSPSNRANSFITQADSLNMAADTFYSVAFQVQSPYVGSDLIVSLSTNSIPPRFTPRVLLVLSRSADPSVLNQRLAEKFILFNGDYRSWNIRNSTVLLKNIQASAQPYYIHLTRAALPNDVRFNVSMIAGLAFPLAEPASTVVTRSDYTFNTTFADMKIQSSLPANAVDLWSFYLPSLLNYQADDYHRFNFTAAIRFSSPSAGAQVGIYNWWRQSVFYSDYFGSRWDQTGTFFCKETAADTPVVSLAIISGNTPATYSASLQDYLGGIDACAFCNGRNV